MAMGKKLVWLSAMAFPTLVAAVLWNTLVMAAPSFEPDLRATAAALTVTSTADAIDTNPGGVFCDGGTRICTMRASIMETDALAVTVEVKDGSASRAAGADVTVEPSPVELDLVGSWPGRGYAVAPGEINGRYYAFLGSVNKVIVVDISDPAKPTKVADIAAPGAFSGLGASGTLRLSDHLLLVAGRSQGLRVIDISDPTNPTEVGFLDTPGIARGVAVSGSMALVADIQALRVIDISDPTSPTEVGFLEVPGKAWGVAVSRGMALVANADYGLRVIDISDPTSPTEVGSVRTPSSAYSVAVSGNLALIADLFGGLRVIDISDPTNPKEVGFVDTPVNAFGVAASGNTALVADGVGGLRVMDISDPSNPTEVGFWNTQSTTVDVAVSGSMALLADLADGLVIVRFGWEYRGMSTAMVWWIRLT